MTAMRLREAPIGTEFTYHLPDACSPEDRITRWRVVGPFLQGVACVVINDDDSPPDQALAFHGDLWIRDGEATRGDF